MIEPPNLQKGSTIAIVATARKISLEEVRPAIRLLSTQGFQVITGKRMFGNENQFSGSDEDRTADMQDMLDDLKVDAILCARGGYGTVRIVDKLDFTEFNKKPKWLCGYSDVTVLHSHINQNLGVCSIHSTMPINMKGISSEHEAFNSLMLALTGGSLHYEFDSNQLNRQGSMEGEVVGGNLSILYSILGSASDIDTKGKILFLEDLDEYLYHIDRMMVNLKRNGKLTALKGLLVGGMSDMNDNTIPFGKTAIEIIREVVEDYDYPVAFNFPAGHIDDNLAIVLGKKATIRVTDSGSEFQNI
ncbi:MAG: LD-carboxypeptidase [Flavobacteriales bacterium]|nr:LD-carboxypeptidase [Flavobacteriales bacterium]